MKKLIYLFLATAFFVSCGGSGLKDKLCDCLDESLEPLQNPLNKQIPHPVSNMIEYFEQPDEFMEIWERYF